nr:M20/M25/M40 family metallo-hydrolase [Shigella sp. FC1764]
MLIILLPCTLALAYLRAPWCAAVIILWQPPNLTRTSPVPPLTQAQNQKTVTMPCWRSTSHSCTACNRPGASRVNVGVMQAGSGRNVVPASALLKVETRGASDVINQYVFDRAQQAIQGAATMYGVGVETRLMGAATASSPSPQWVAWLQSQAAQVAGGNQAIERVEAPAGSEDATLMMARVQQHQGQASYVVFGTQLAAGHHNEKFDFDEQVLAIAVETLARTALNFPWTRGI